jgi:hypothetical protein
MKLRAWFTRRKARLRRERQVTNRAGLETEGTVDKVGGTTQRTIGYFQKAVEKR